MAQQAQDVQGLQVMEEHPRSAETRVYYRLATVISFVEKSTGNELKHNTPQLVLEIKRRMALGEVEEKRTEMWIPTRPLPADFWHMNYYAKKGFKLSPPEQESAKPVESVKVKTEGKAISCPMDGCTFIARTYIGLARHMRDKHDQK